MAEDGPPDPRAEARRKAHAQKYGIPIDRVIHHWLDPWAWAAARGLKPLPGREIPPEYRHLFEKAGGAGAEEPSAPSAPPVPAVESATSRAPAPAEPSQRERPLTAAEKRILQLLVDDARLRKALERDDLPEQ